MSSSSLSSSEGRRGGGKSDLERGRDEEDSLLLQPPCTVTTTTTSTSLLLPTEHHPSSSNHCSSLHHRRKYSSTDNDNCDDAGDDAVIVIKKTPCSVSSSSQPPVPSFSGGSPMLLKLWSSSSSSSSSSSVPQTTTMMRIFFFCGLFISFIVASTSSSSSSASLSWLRIGPDRINIEKMIPPSLNRKIDPDGFLSKILPLSAFPRTMYDNIYQHPQNDPNVYKCQPRKIHLSQKSDVNVVAAEAGAAPDPDGTDQPQKQQQQVVNMTVSFTVDKENCGSSNITTVVVYGQQQTQGQEQQQRQHQRRGVLRGIIDWFLDNNSNFWTKADNLQRRMVVVTPSNNRPSTTTSNRGSEDDDDDEIDPFSEVVQFEYNSPVTGPSYQSDYIHHVTLPNLQPGSRYWYRIIIVAAEGEKESLESSSSSSSKFSFLTVPVPDFLSRYMHDNESSLSSSSSSSSQSNDNRNGIENKNDARRRKETTLPPQIPSLSSLFSLRGSYYQVIGQTNVYTFPTPPRRIKSTISFTGSEQKIHYSSNDDDDDRTTTPSPVTTLALVGDLGQTENSTKTMFNIMNSDATSLIIAGDLSYADGDPYRWESWLELMEPLLRSLPMSSVPGNHEIECDDVSHQVFTPYESYFRNPNRLPENPDRVPPSDDYRKTLWHGSCTGPSEFLGHYNYGNAFTSYRHGLAHIILLNSYTSVNASSIQYDWLKHTAFPSVDRDITPWLIVVFHVPIYTTFLGHNGEINSVNMKESIEDLLLHNHVNLVVSGHDHAYSRSKKMYRSEPHPGGPVYLTLGAGGNREQHTRGYIHPDHPESWIAKRENDEYGFGLLKIPNATHAHLSWRRDHTCSAGDKCVRDNVWIENIVR